MPIFGAFFGVFIKLWTFREELILTYTKDFRFSLIQFMGFMSSLLLFFKDTLKVLYKVGPISCNGYGTKTI